MNLIIDGLNRGGKKEFAEMVSTEFNPLRLRKVGKPNSDSFISPDFYSKRLIQGMKEIDRSFVHLWDYGWVSAIVSQQMKGRLVDEFQYEFLLRRLLGNRGGYFIVLPETKELYFNQFPETEIETFFVPRTELEKEYDLYMSYANRWGYDVVTHNFVLDPLGISELEKPERESIQGEIIRARKKTLLEDLPFSTREYLGSTNPVLTFVGDIQKEFAIDLRPFHSPTQSEFFKPFGENAIHHFGYCSVDGYLSIRESRWAKKLLRRIVTVGSKARHILPTKLTVSGSLEKATDHSVQKFENEVLEIADKYGLNLK